MSETDRKPPITLEDLLQIKRAERPPAEFWTHFDQELRAKQLAAIVETGSWWRGLTAKKIFVRVCVPLGAAAAMAMVFGSFRSQVSQPSPAPLAGERVAVQDALTLNKTSAVVSVGAPLLADSSVSVVSSNVVEQGSGSVGQSATVAVQTTERGAGVSTVQALASMAGPVMAAGQSLAQLAGICDSEHASAGSVLAAAVEPLTQVATPRDSRRSRLLAYSVSFDPHAADSLDAARLRERTTHRLANESVCDSITRLGVSGNRVSIKF